MCGTNQAVVHPFSRPANFGTLYEKVITARYRSCAETCRAELHIRPEAVLEENQSPSLRSIYARFGVTESIVNTRCRSGADSGNFSAHQRPGNLPSVPRVPSWLKSRSLGEWTVVCKAVTDARKELCEDLGPSEKVRFDLNHMPAAPGSYS
jgi:hypothetical protein